ncbi:hypothetical protein AGABI2DRAFT_149875 [Agaricus bisporus var. bisporus H97]|uniref:hypothetical protein n=1 Tax=Agaricus bisporus var. bisporus (strain H97 / ATCC MYA-4626 / FGSC 10389) TaxID=936046 RepID=UPI00029F5450|nr:hypothetical protein AGABI2DRAFT_149875 [Agaricus bisporus var. bisporus H97]EKV48039.1 hypothetical protein AGABI2DRAFT_149875 [Agaricus bisporus var. bisporus H97]
MRLSSTFAALVAIVPAFVNAIPPRIGTTIPTRVGTVIPLTKRAVHLADEQGVVDCEVLRSQVTKVSRKLGRGFQAYQKNTGKAHPNAMKELLELLETRATGSVPLIDDQEVLWHGSISVGTPPKEFTGSSDLFLPGATCGATCQGHEIYDTSASSTAQDQSRDFSLLFGDGSSIQGEVFSDTVTLGGLTVTNQAVGSATQYSTGFSAEQFPPDGLMGMAFPQISEFRANPFFQTLVAQGGADAPQFGFKLSTQGSELFLGGVNNNSFTGEFTNIDITQQGFWQIPLDSVNTGGSSAVQNVQAAIDTGTTLIVAPQQEAIQLYLAIPGAKDASNVIGPGFFTFPCNSDPQISLTFGGKAFAIPTNTFNLGQLFQGSEDCVGGITGTTNIPLWVVGDVFLSNFYTKFDAGANQVGFADLA